MVAAHPESFNLSQDSTYFNPYGRAVEGKQVSEIIRRSLTNKSALLSGAKM